MSKILFIILALVFVLPTKAQENINIIKVESTAEIIVEADIAVINIVVASEGKTNKEINQKWEKQKDNLLSILEENGINDSAISIQSPEYRMNTQKSNDTLYYSHREIVIILEDLNKYENVQEELSKLGVRIYMIYSSRNFDGLKEKCYEEAVRIAYEDAEIIAKSMSVELGKINKVEFKTNNYPTIERYRYNSPSKMALIAQKDRTNIRQSFVLKTTIDVEFEIIEK